MRGVFLSTIVEAKHLSSGVSRYGPWDLIQVTVVTEKPRKRIVKGVLIGSKVKKMLRSVLGNERTGNLKKDLIACKRKACVAQIKQLSLSVESEVDAVFGVDEFDL